MEIDGAPRPLLVPLGEAGLLVRFGATLTDAANWRAIGLARAIEAGPPQGVLEIAPNLISVLVRYDPAVTTFATLAGEVRLLLSAPVKTAEGAVARHRLEVSFGGVDGPDLEAAAAALQLAPAAFIAAHNASPLRVLATGFAPGFVYCGLHPKTLHLPRRKSVRPPVPPGSVLFAAGQTALTSTAIPTGWYVIGRTGFRNFDPYAEPPTTLQAGDSVAFEAVS